MGDESIDGIERSLVTYLEQERGVDPRAFSGDAGLFSDGAMDSFEILGLLKFAEDRYSVTFQAYELRMEDLDSMSRFAASIAKKLEKATST